MSAFQYNTDKTQNSMSTFSYHIAFIQSTDTFLLNKIFTVRITRIIDFWKLKGLYWMPSIFFLNCRPKFLVSQENNLLGFNHLKKYQSVVIASIVLFHKYIWMCMCLCVHVCVLSCDQEENIKKEGLSREILGKYVGQGLKTFILASRDIVMMAESHFRRVSWVSISGYIGLGNLRTESMVMPEWLEPCLLALNDLALYAKKSLVWNSPHAPISTWASFLSCSFRTRLSWEAFRYFPHS